MSNDCYGLGTQWSSKTNNGRYNPGQEIIIDRVNNYHLEQFQRAKKKYSIKLGRIHLIT